MMISNKQFELASATALQRQSSLCGQMCCKHGNALDSDCLWTSHRCGQPLDAGTGPPDEQSMSETQEPWG